MKMIHVSFAVKEKPHLKEGLITLEKNKGIKPLDIGKKMADFQGKKVKTETALYRSFRRGERRISNTRLPVLVKIFGVEIEYLKSINGHDSTIVKIEIPCETTINQLLDQVTITNDTTISDFLTELYLLFERKKLSTLMK